MVRKLAELLAEEGGGGGGGDGGGDGIVARVGELAERLLALGARPSPASFDDLAEAEPSFLQPENLGLCAALDRLLCIGAGGGAVAVQPADFFASLAQGSDQTRCGRLFSSNEIVYRCSTCGVDPTCVMCARCFDAKAHDGHEVTFYSSSGRGGCCDGGDPEAWVPSAPAILRGIKKQTTEVPQLPAPVADAASQLFRACFGFTLRLLSDTARSFEPGAIDSWDEAHRDAGGAPVTPESPGDTERSSFRVRLHNDDVHTFEDVIHALQQHALPRVDARAAETALHAQAAREIATSVHNAGSADAWSGDVGAARPVVDGLREEGLLVSVAPRWAALPKRSAIAVVLVGWIHRVVQTSKQLAALAGNALLEQFDHYPTAGQQTVGLLALVQHNDLLDVKLVQALHDMYLALFAAEDDQAFRRQFGLIFVRSYRAINTRWTLGVGTQEESVFGLAVQLLTVPSMLPILQEETDVLGTLLLSLRDMLQATQAPVDDGSEETGRSLDLSHHCFRHSRYRHIVQDMVHVLRCNASMPMMLVSRPELLGYWCDSLALVQGVAEETRQAGAHVEYENEHWVSAFELTWSLTQMSHDILSAIYGAIDKLEDDQARVTAMRTVGAVCFEHLTAWVEKDGTVGAPYNVATQPVTFHLPLSRALAIALRRSSTCISSTNSIGPHSLFETFISLRDGPACDAQIFRLIEHPLRTSAFAAQVQVGMWKRNGASVAHEAVNYAGTNNRVLMADLDLTVLQLGAARVKPDDFLGALFDRFGIREWAAGAPATDSDDGPPQLSYESQKALAEECLVLIIQIINELPRSPRLPASTGLRRELLHRLCAVGDAGCSHSRLSECARIARRQTMVESDFFSPEQVDAEISAVAEFKENADPMQPGRYVLREASVLEYDPHYFHLNRNEHEQARDWIEGIRKKARDLQQPRPCVQAPSEPHEFFASSFRIFEATAMVGMWRLVLQSAIAVSSSAGEDSALPGKPSTAAVTDGIIDSSLQLLTMAVHCQKYLPEEGGQGRRPLYAAIAADPLDGTPCILLLLHQLQTQIAEENPSIAEATAWIIAEMVAADAECEQKLRRVTGASSPSNKTSLEEKRKQLKQEAQRRAMADMQKMQMSFLAGMDSDSSDEDDMALVSTVTPHEETGATEAAASGDGGDGGDDAASLPTCALSHEVSQPDRLVGMMAFAQRSCVASGSPLRGGVCVHFYGHALHFDRYDTYYVTLVDKMEQNQPYEGMHSIDVDRGEFLSPVCKSICNLLVPAVVNGAASVRAAAAVATKATVEAPDGVASWLLGAVETAYDTSRDTDTFPLDAGVCSTEHVARMLSTLYDLAKGSPAQKNVLTMLQAGSEVIAYSLEARDMCRALPSDGGAATPLWPELQLRQMRTMFDGIRAYAAHLRSAPEPLMDWIRVQLVDLMQGAPRDGWCGIANGASAWQGNASVRTSQMFEVGEPVLIHGLRSSAAMPLNGQRGQIEKYDENKGRFVCLVDGKTFSVKPTNLVSCRNAVGVPAHILEADTLRLLAIAAVHATSRADLLNLARCFFVVRLVQATFGPGPASSGDDAAMDEEQAVSDGETPALICSMGGDGRKPLTLSRLRQLCLPFMRRAIMLVGHVALRLGDDLPSIGCSVEDEYAWCAGQLGLSAPCADQPEPELALVQACRPAVEA